MNLPRADLARMIDAARRMVVFTGAGISTESGIPDFRSPGGIWSRIEPIYFQEFVSNPAKRRESWRLLFSGQFDWSDRTPNAGHYAVARLVKSGKAFAVITQNVDNLHQKAGVPPEKVIELHGNMSYAFCLDCGKRYDIPTLKERFLRTDESPACDACGGIVKTGGVSFGEPMPEDAMRRAEQAALNCDLCLVLGSSLVVYPAAGFPVMAKRHGAKLAILNREPTELDGHADIVLNAEIGPILSEIVP